MNTINLIIAIALLACILTPAYVLYFLKYQLFANQKRYKATIDTISNDLSKLHYEVEKIQFDEVENRLERSKQYLELNDKIDSSHKKHSMTQNNVDNINVSLDYLRRTLNSDMSKVNERIDLVKSTYQNDLTKIRSEFNNVNSKIHTTDLFRNGEISRKINAFNKQLDDLQSLNITTQQILNRINSKEFAQEVLYAWMKTIKQEKVSEQNEVETPNKPKRGRPSKKQERITRTIPATELFQYEEQQETPIVAVEPKEKKKRSPKRNSKRLITMREIETAFKDKTGLTYRGYVLKFGEKEFLKKKGNVYDSVYYQKFTKPKQQNLAFKRTDG